MNTIPFVNESITVYNGKEFAKHAFELRSKGYAHFKSYNNREYYINSYISRIVEIVKL